MIHPELEGNIMGAVMQVMTDRGAAPVCFGNAKAVVDAVINVIPLTVSVTRSDIDDIAANVQKHLAALPTEAMEEERKQLIASVILESLFAKKV